MSGEGAVDRALARSSQPSPISGDHPCGGAEGLTPEAGAFEGAQDERVHEQVRVAGNDEVDLPARIPPGPVRVDENLGRTGLRGGRQPVDDDLRGPGLSDPKDYVRPVLAGEVLDAQQCVGGGDGRRPGVAGNPGPRPGVGEHRPT